MCNTASGWDRVCNKTFGGPGCNVPSCPHCPLHSFCLESGRGSASASARACERKPDVTGAPVQIIFRPEKVRRNNGQCDVTCNTWSRTVRLFLSPSPTLSQSLFFFGIGGFALTALEPSPFMMPASTSPLQNNRSSFSTSAQRHGGEPIWRFDLPS